MTGSNDERESRERRKRKREKECMKRPRVPFISCKIVSGRITWRRDSRLFPSPKCSKLSDSFFRRDRGNGNGA